MAWEGAFAVVPAEFDGWFVSTEFCTFQANPSQLDTSYLGYLFRRPQTWEMIAGSSIGTNVRRRRLYPQDFLAKVVPLPDVDEQRRVAAKLHTLTERFSEADTLTAAADKHASALLPASQAKLLGRIEHDWDRVVGLDSVAHVEMGQSPPGYAYNEDGIGLPLLNGPTEFGDRTPKPRQWTSVITKICEPEDLLFSVRASIGRMNWADRRYCIGRGLAAIRAKADFIVPSYLRHVLAARAREVMEMTAGSTFLNLPGAKLATLQIPLPSLDEQVRVSGRLDRIEQQARSVSARLTDSSRLLRALQLSVLNRAFAGEL